jgi:hypothetical protein
MLVPTDGILILVEFSNTFWGKGILPFFMVGLRLGLPTKILVKFHAPWVIGNKCPKMLLDCTGGNDVFTEMMFSRMVNEMSWREWRMSMKIEKCHPNPITKQLP